MATFPTLSHGPSVNSDEMTVDDIQADRATNGAPRIRAMFTAPKKTFSIVYQGMTSTDKSTVETFYTTNRLISFVFVWAADGVSYTVYFSGPIKYKYVDGIRWDITMDIIQA